MGWFKTFLMKAQTWVLPDGSPRFFETRPRRLIGGVVTGVTRLRASSLWCSESRPSLSLSDVSVDDAIGGSTIGFPFRKTRGQIGGITFSGCVTLFCFAGRPRRLAGADVTLPSSEGVKLELEPALLNVNAICVKRGQMGDAEFSSHFDLFASGVTQSFAFRFQPRRRLRRRPPLVEVLLISSWLELKKMNKCDSLEQEYG